MEYTELKNDPEQFLKEQTIVLWGRWLLRNSKSDLAADVAIIPPFITKAVKDLVSLFASPSCYNSDLNKKLVFQLDTVDKYLYGHPEILTKRLIFFVINDEEGQHWYGFCAVNPWQAIVNEHLALGNKKR